MQNPVLPLNEKETDLSVSCTSSAQSQTKPMARVLNLLLLFGLNPEDFSCKLLQYEGFAALTGQHNTDLAEDQS